MARVLIVATSRKTRGGITSVIKAHETGEQWKKYHCRWVETHRDGTLWRKVWYLITGMLEFICLLSFYDIIHMHVSFQGSLKRKCIIMWLSKLCGKKTIVHFHPPTPDVLKNVDNHSKYKYLFENADKVIVLSNQWIMWIKDLIYDEKSPNNLVVLYNPCPTINKKDIVPIENREKYILFAGTLIVRKGYKCLIRSFASLAKKYPNWKVIFAGVDEDKQAEDIIKGFKLESQIILVGWCNKEKMRNLYRKASIYCLPSSGEGFPMVVLESWAYGTPVVCTPVGGLPDILEEGKNALSFDFDDDKMLSMQLDKLMSNESLRLKLSKAGLKLSKDVFNVEVINQQLGKLYQELAYKNRINSK